MRNKIVTLATAGVCTTTVVIGGAIASDFSLDLTGLESWDLEGDASNYIHQEDLGVNSKITHAGFDNVVICTQGFSWASECWISFASTAGGDGLYFNFSSQQVATCPGDGSDTGPAGPYTSGGLIDIENDAGLPPINLADGILVIELFESYDDVGDSVDGVYSSGSLDFLYQAEGETAICGPSLNPLCSMDQAGSGAYDPDGVPDTGDEIADGKDGSVGLEDFSAMLVNFGTSVDCDTESRPQGDGHPCVDASDCFGDGDVDLEDFSKLLVQFRNAGADCGELGYCHYDDGSCVEANIDECVADTQGNDSPGALYFILIADVTDADADGDIDCLDAFPLGVCCDSSTGTCSDVTIGACDGLGGTWTAGATCADGTVTCNLIPNEDCDSALPITMGSSTAYDSSGAATDGPVHDFDADGNELCPYGGQTYHDLYYYTTVGTTGGVRITTCATLGESTYDTDLVGYIYADQAAFDARDCTDLATNFAGCNEDSPDCLDSASGVGDPFHSNLLINADAGNIVLVRVGGWNEGDQGAGVITVEEVACDPAYERPNNCTTNAVVNNGQHGFTAYYVDDTGVDCDGDGTNDASLDFGVEFNGGAAGLSFNSARLMWVDLSSPPGSNNGMPGTDATVTFYDITGVDLTTHDWTAGGPGSVLYTEDLLTGFGNVAWYWLGEAWNIGETCEVVMELSSTVTVPADAQVLMVCTFPDLPTSAYADWNGDGVIDSADENTHFLWTVNQNDFCADSVGPYHIVGTWNPDTDGDGVGDGCGSYNLDPDGGDLEPGADYNSFAFHLCD